MQQQDDRQTRYFQARSQAPWSHRPGRVKDGLVVGILRISPHVSEVAIRSVPIRLLHWCLQHKMALSGRCFLLDKDPRRCVTV